MRRKIKRSKASIKRSETFNFLDLLSSKKGVSANTKQLKTQGRIGFVIAIGRC